MPQFRVIADHRRSYELPIRGKAGDPVRLGKRDEDAPAWIWCVHDISDLAGWVPEALLEVRGTQGTLKRDYDAIELKVSVGEMLDVTEALAGWSRCNDANGNSGWVPSEKLRPAG